MSDSCPSDCRPFEISFTDDAIARVSQRVADYPWHEMPDDGGWEYGTNLPYLKELCDYWVERYDWRVHETQLNQLNHFVADIQGIDIHFVYEKGSGDSAKPLLLSHGWPGSVYEFKDIIEPLAHPERFGGNINDAFDVIAPSLPGFAFSGRPARPIGPRKMADIFNHLMTRTLGYERYLAQGGDWGGAICSWLGFEHAHACQAIHINILTMRHPGGPQGEEETAWAEKFDRDQVMEDGYRTQQATRPQTLSYAMMDSPVGIAAWLLEKYNSWSDTRAPGSSSLAPDTIESHHRLTEQTGRTVREDSPGNDISLTGENREHLEHTYTKDQLLTHIMIYVLTRTFNTASWIYYGRREEGGRLFSDDGRRVEVPTACALFPAEMLAWPPRSYVERLYNVKQWSQFERGGHFAAMEQPQLLVQDIRQFARTLKSSS